MPRYFPGTVHKEPALKMAGEGRRDLHIPKDIDCFRSKLPSLRLCEKYGKPCIVISKSGDVAKGSGRSIDGFSLYDALSFCKDILVQ